MLVCDLKKWNWNISHILVLTQSEKDESIRMNVNFSSQPSLHLHFSYDILFYWAMWIQNKKTVEYWKQCMRIKLLENLLQFTISLTREGNSIEISWTKLNRTASCLFFLPGFSYSSRSQDSRIDQYCEIATKLKNNEVECAEVHIFAWTQ